MTEPASKVEANRPKRQKTGGRVKGTLNKATADVKLLAREYGPQAINTLAGIMLHGEGPSQVAAARELLDRAYGKATTVIAGDPDRPLLPARTIVELVSVALGTAARPAS